MPNEQSPIDQSQSGEPAGQTPIGPQLIEQQPPALADNKDWEAMGYPPPPPPPPPPSMPDKGSEPSPN